MVIWIVSIWLLHVILNEKRELARHCVHQACQTCVRPDGHEFDIFGHLLLNVDS